jgi:hypothetical protein
LRYFDRAFKGKGGRRRKEEEVLEGKASNVCCIPAGCLLSQAAFMIFSEGQRKW